MSIDKCFCIFLYSSSALNFKIEHTFSEVIQKFLSLCFSWQIAWL